MANKTGWWSLETTIPPDANSFEYIGKLIQQGYTQGEIINTDEED